jgi:hypothetical protein
MKNGNFLLRTACKNENSRKKIDQKFEKSEKIEILEKKFKKFSEKIQGFSTKFFKALNPINEICAKNRFKISIEFLENSKSDGKFSKFYIFDMDKGDYELIEMAKTLALKP